MPHKKPTKKILIIGGFDPTGNAGVLRDFEACLRFETPTATLVTALTAQNDQKFFTYAPVDLKMQNLTWKSFESQSIGAIKIGMLGDDAVVAFLIRKLVALKTKNPKIKIVWDPVFASSSGASLLTAKSRKLALQKILPMTDLVTPNAEEACRLLGVTFSKNLEGQMLAESLKAILPTRTSLYLKGGHLSTKCHDWFMGQGERFELQGRASPARLRGTGCLFATAAACGFSAGLTAAAACEQAKEFLDEMFAAAAKH